MTRDEYERSKARLEEQRRAGIELLETAFQAQVRALDLVWMIQGEEAGAGRTIALAAPEPAAPAPAEQEPFPPAPPPRRRSGPEVDDDVRAALPQLPERFTRRDIVEILGYEPERGALYRSLLKLVEEGRTRVESYGGGQRATVYCKTGGEPSVAQA